MNCQPMPGPAKRCTTRTQVLAVPEDLEDSALREVLRTLLDQEEQLDAAYVGDGEGRVWRFDAP